MNRQVLGLAMAFLLTGAGAASGQATARVEYKSGWIGVAIAVGDLPVHVRSRSLPAFAWVAADLGPVRIWATPGRPFWRREVLNRDELRHLVGRETVKGIERHAKALGLRGSLEGRWFRMDRHSVLLEVSVRGRPVAELHDYGSDGLIDRVLLVGEGRYDHRFGSDDDDDRYRRGGSGRPGSGDRSGPA